MWASEQGMRSSLSSLPKGRPSSGAGACIDGAALHAGKSAELCVHMMQLSWTW